MSGSVLLFVLGGLAALGAAFVLAVLAIRAWGAAARRRAERRELEPPPIDGRGPWRRYACALCGHVYDERAGHLPAGVEPGTRFEDLPDDWVCPDCGATKDQFLPL